MTGAKGLKAFLLALVLLVVCAFAAQFVLTGRTVASSDRYVASDSVRLDPEMRSDLPRGGVEGAER